MSVVVATNSSLANTKTGDLITDAYSVCEGVTITSTASAFSLLPGVTAGINKYFGYYHININAVVGDCTVTLPPISSFGAGVRNGWSAKIRCQTAAGNSIILEDDTAVTVGIVNGGLMALVTANFSLNLWDVQYFLGPGQPNQLIETSTAGVIRWTDDVIVNGTLTVVGQTFLGDNINAGGTNATFSYNQFNINGDLQMSGASGLAGEVLYKTSGTTQVWSKITGIRARFTTSTSTNFYQGGATTLIYTGTTYNTSTGTLYPLVNTGPGDYQVTNACVASIYFQANAANPASANSSVEVGLYINGVAYQVFYWDANGINTATSMQFSAFPILAASDTISIRYRGLAGGSPFTVDSAVLSVILN
jgi:hypothetical protein